MTATLLALAAGALVGLALGGLGGGGSMLAVPALVYLLGFSPRQAASAALVIVALTSAGGLLAHLRTGTCRCRAGALFAAAGLPFAAAAGLLSARLPGALLTAGFAIVATLAAWRMLRTDGTVRTDQAGRGRIAATGAGLGTLTGLLGVGGGFLAVPALVSALAFPMAEAAGTSLLVITTNALAALLGRTGSLAGLDWAVIGPFTGAAVLGAWDGKRLAERFSGAALQRAFALVLLAVAALMVLDAAL
ncbi:sulfite exporter TauE/SafE family protein [Streptomyces hokutonensis]|uniref:sulfite exporter TauE/SafE family protein n=1 Tax=Streptomyces hokutonensis TaxID=1306990 RepID=UPI0038040C1D